MVSTIPMAGHAGADHGLADRMAGLAAMLGVAWKAHRRRMPSDVKTSFVNLMANIREYMVPDPGASAERNIKYARDDVRLVTELLRPLATRCSHGDGDDVVELERRAITTLRTRAAPLRPLPA